RWRRQVSAVGASDREPAEEADLDGRCLLVHGALRSRAPVQGDILVRNSAPARLEPCRQYASKARRVVRSDDKFEHGVWEVISIPEPGVTGDDFVGWGRIGPQRRARNRPPPIEDANAIRLLACCLIKADDIVLDDPTVLFIAA